MPFNYNKFNDLLFELKKNKKGITDETLAQKMEFSMSTFNRLKRPEANPTSEALEKIALVMGVDANYFFTAWDDLPTRVAEIKEEKVVDITPDYILDRYEKMAQESGELRIKLEYAEQKITALNNEIDRLNSAKKSGGNKYNLVAESDPNDE